MCMILRKQENKKKGYLFRLKWLKIEYEKLLENEYSFIAYFSV